MDATNCQAILKGGVEGVHVVSPAEKAHLRARRKCMQLIEKDKLARLWHAQPSESRLTKHMNCESILHIVLGEMVVHYKLVQIVNTVMHLAAAEG